MADTRQPPAPTAEPRGSSVYKPWEVNPDLASAKLASDMLEKMGTPGIVSKPFVVWQGIFVGLNHGTSNETYYDSSMRNAIYQGVFHNSVNIDGALFHSFWTYMNKPKMIVQGIPGQDTFTEEPKESLWDKGMRLLGRGGDKNGSKSE